MKFSSATIVTILATAAYAQSASSVSEAVAGTTTSAAAVPTVTDGPQEACRKEKCKDNDQACVAQCYGVPSPNTQMVIDTTQCAMKCKQGNGTQAETEAYAKCQQDCISASFFPTGGAGSPQTAGGASGSGAAASATGGARASASSASGSAQPTQTGAAALNAPAAGFAGIMAILFAAAL